MSLNFNQQMDRKDPNSLYNHNRLHPRIEIAFAIYHGPRRFYEAIIQTVTKTAAKSSSFDLTQIPNVLKIVEDSRRLVTARINEPCQWPMEKILGHMIDSTFYLHIARGKGSLSYNREGEGFDQMDLEIRTTYQFNQYAVKGTRFNIRCDEFLQFAIDICEPLLYEGGSGYEEIERFTYQPPMAIINYKSSYLSKPMSKEEIRNRIIFLDIECGQDDNNLPILLSVAAINYDGEVLMCEYVCPRTHVKRYCNEIHGIMEEDVIAQRDSGLVMEEIERMLRGRIIIGHDLHLEHVVLPIRLDRIVGVRDLQSSRAMARIMNSDLNSLSLGAIAKRLNIEKQSDLHTALEEADLVRKIYIKTEDAWTDTSTEEIEKLHMKEITRLPPRPSRLVEKSRKKQIEEVKKVAEEEKRRKEVAAEQRKQRVFGEVFIPPLFPEQYLELADKYMHDARQEEENHRCEINQNSKYPNFVVKPFTLGLAATTSKTVITKETPMEQQKEPDTTNLRNNAEQPSTSIETRRPKSFKPSKNRHSPQSSKSKQEVKPQKPSTQPRRNKSPKISRRTTDVKISSANTSTDTPTKKIKLSDSQRLPKQVRKPSIKAKNDILVKTNYQPKSESPQVTKKPFMFLVDMDEDIGLELSYSPDSDFNSVDSDKDEIVPPKRVNNLMVVSDSDDNSISIKVSNTERQWAIAARANRSRRINTKNLDDKK